MPVKVVQERLGHKKVEITMNIYQHVLPDMQEDAAAKMVSILFCYLSVSYLRREYR